MADVAQHAFEGLVAHHHVVQLAPFRMYLPFFIERYVIISLTVATMPAGTFAKPVFRLDDAFDFRHGLLRLKDALSHHQHANGVKGTAGAAGQTTSARRSSRQNQRR